MGRHAGWLAGAAALATASGEGPDLVYLPEVDFDVDKFYADVEPDLQGKGQAALLPFPRASTITTASFVSEYANDLCHRRLRSCPAGRSGCRCLQSMLKEQDRLPRVRGIELSLLQRCGAHLASETDIDEALCRGQGCGGELPSPARPARWSAFERTVPTRPTPARRSSLPLEKCANFEKKVPLEWINAEGNGVTQDFIDYCPAPDSGRNRSCPRKTACPGSAKLKKVLAK